MQNTFKASLIFAAWLMCAAFGFAGLAQADAPLVGGPEPGFYRLMVGAFEVTALNDGTRALPIAKILTNTQPGEVEKVLDAAFLKDPVATSFNAFLVNTGAKLVLIDTGAGSLMGPGLGYVVGNLKAAGYRPEQVDEVYITHMHPDHVGGLMAGDQRVFPNAMLRANQRDVDYWLSASNLAAAPEDQKAGFENAMASVNPYIDAGKFKAFDGTTDLIPGIESIPTPGHTPGHSSYLVASGGERMLICGDIVHVAAVQFPDPAVTIVFDSDPAKAAASRKQVLADAARQRDWIAGAHISFPGIGHVRVDGGGYRWVPVNYVRTPTP